MNPRELPVAVDRELDGRWIAEVPAIPGAIVYGSSPEDAIAVVRRLAEDVIEDRRVHGEPLPNSGCERGADELSEVIGLATGNDSAPENLPEERLSTREN
ncbi:MAG TPA: type II toxin-antitoxin system HicB family antitoxin [Longimicrobium sp.]